MFKIIFAFLLLSTSGLAAPPPPAIQSVGSISVYAAHNMKVLVDWYKKFGFDLQLGKEKDKETGKIVDVYYGSFKNQAGPPYFAIHPKHKNAPQKNSKSISLVFHVNDYNGYVSMLESEDLKAYDHDSDESGHFAYYRDPDGNEMTIWGD